MSPRNSSFMSSISIHAAREGGDVQAQKKRHSEPSFQSTPPVKAATVKQALQLSTMPISIHAAREGGDLAYISPKIYIKYFNPRRP